MDLLSTRVRPVCFVRVPRAPISLGVRITCIALAGTIAALGMFGHRRGGITDPFAGGGHLLSPGGSPIAAIFVGIAIHVVWIAAWSMLLAAFAQRDRRGRASIGAVIVAALALGVSMIAPPSLGGPLATLEIPERVVVHVVLAIAFLLGMRLAPRGDGPAVRRVSNDEGSPVAE